MRVLIIRWCSKNACVRLHLHSYSKKRLKKAFTFVKLAILITIKNAIFTILKWTLPYRMLSGLPLLLCFALSVNLVVLTVICGQSGCVVVHNFALLIARYKNELLTSKETVNKWRRLFMLFCWPAWATFYLR